MSTMQEFLETRLVQAVVEHAAGMVDMHYDCEECDIQMRHNDYKSFSIEETIESFTQMGVDFFIDNDMNESDVVSFNRIKMLEMTTKLIKNDLPTQAYLAQCALLLRGYQIGAKSMGLLAHHVGKQFREN